MIITDLNLLPTNAKQFCNITFGILVRDPVIAVGKVKRNK
jgi:hypothetical protein